MIALKCPGCGRDIQDQPAAAEILCPGCGRMIRVDESKTDLLERDQADSSISENSSCSNAQTGMSVPPSCREKADRPDISRLFRQALDPTLGPAPALESVATAKEFAFLGPPDETGDLGRLAHYRVIKVLGKGGMGMVFEAMDVHLQRTVALKVMRPDMGTNSELRQRFLREARATAAVKSDHIVTIHQVGQENDVPYLAMEYLQGMPLDRWLAQMGTPPIREALRLGTEIAKGLAAAHNCGLIHRDIKPSNIWIEEPGGRVKILDFGLVRATRDEMRLTQTGVVMGTPEYLAPEQADGSKVDERSDLYSLGCVMYELLTGNPPFTGPSVMSILRAVATEEAAPVRKLNPDVPADLAKIVMQLLAKDPANRYSSAAEVEHDLEALLASPATRLSGGHPAGFPKPPIRRTGRRKWLVAVGAGMLAAGLLLAFGWPKPDRSAQTTTGAVPELHVKKLAVRHFAKRGDQVEDRGLLGEKPFDCRLDDQVTVEVVLSRPAYGFLIAFRPDGSDELCFPESEDQPPPLTERPRYPSQSRGVQYGLNEGTGLAAFAVVASARPLPAYPVWRKLAGKSPWQAGQKAPPEVGWYDDGGRLEILPPGNRNRSKGRQALGATPVVRVRDWLAHGADVEAAAVFAFVVQPKEP